MFLNQLTIRNFRNLKSQTINFNHNLCAFLGDNAQGKTSVLEAIFLLSQRFSFREANSREVVSWNITESDLCLIEGDISTRDGNKTVSVAIKDGRKSVKLNNNIIRKASDFFGLVKVIEFVPEDLLIVKGEPKLRRNFLDRTISLIDKNYIDELVLYQRALKNRNSLLKIAKKDGLSIGEITEEISIWDKAIVSHGKILALKRLSFIKELQVVFTKYNNLLLSLYKEDKENISIDYESDFIKNKTILEDEFILKTLKNELAKDLAIGSSSIGAHRDDLDIGIRYKNKETRSARRGASQGQSRTISLALKIAAFEIVAEKTNEKPIIILDDVESELDRSRRDALGELLLNLNAQILITATDLDPSLEKALKTGQILRVEDGLVSV